MILKWSGRILATVLLSVALAITAIGVPFAWLADWVREKTDPMWNFWLEPWDAHGKAHNLRIRAICAEMDADPKWEHLPRWHGPTQRPS